MTQITASMVKQLREETGAGMMDAKKALTESGGEMEAARDWLRTKGLSKAAKKSDRAASEGLVALATSANMGAMVEVNAETDFVARNEQFQGFVQDVAQIALENKGDMDAIRQAPYPNTDRTVDEQLTHLIATIGENMTLRRATFLEVPTGVIASYMHSAVTAGMGRIGVLVALESEGDAAKLEGVGRQVAMHVAATNPMALKSEDLDAAVIERERAIYAEQAKESGKPEEIVEKMVDGRMRKFFEEVCLMQQTFVIDGESKVADILQKEIKEVGSSIELRQFVRFGLGEGVEKAEDDFAAEVKRMAS